MNFKEDFFGGAASASYHIEGAITEDGKGLNVWDMMCFTPEAIFEEQHGQRDRVLSMSQREARTAHTKKTPFELQRQNIYVKQLRSCAPRDS